tara:strand:+ start:215 stop:1546 length:1332 start_codon:yes stop_codon:yes gene_type:complete
LKKSLFISILLLVVYSCSPEEEMQVPTNTVQTTLPEPETQVLTQYTITVTAGDGGSVTDGGTFDEGTNVTITATPNEGYRFTGWEGSDSTSESFTVTLNSNQTFGAIFELIPVYTLTVTSVEGGTVSSEGGSYDEGTEVTINATPDEGYEFVGWEGNDSSDSNLTITLNSNQTVQPIFQAVQPISQNEEYNYEYNQLDINEPPFYDGTIFASGDIITSADPSLFSEIEYKGTGQREMYDRRNGGAWINIEAYIFDTSFSDGLKTEIQINSEFTLEEATAEANKYAFLIGQLPTLLRQDVETMWIHKGYEGYGGGNNNLLVHTGMTETYENYFAFGEGDPSIVEETLIHEATHTSIDYHYESIDGGYGAGWVEAVNNDNGCYISNYALQYPYREDVAEIMLMYIAVKYFPERITPTMRDQILSCNLNRINHFDSLNLDLSLYSN